MAKPAVPKVGTRRHIREEAAFLAAARAVKENRGFADASGPILRASKALLEADAALIALRSATGKGFEVALADSGRLTFATSSALPASLRRLGAQASEGRSVFANDLARKGGRRTAPRQAPLPGNALLVPITVDGSVAGLLALVDKPGGFRPADCKKAEVFAEMVAITLLARRTVNGLERNRKALEIEVRENVSKLQASEETFRRLVENLPDIVARFDRRLRHLYVSPAVETATGRPAESYLGKTNRELGMPSAMVRIWNGGLRRVFATGRPERFEFEFATPKGTHHYDCRLAPEPGPGGSVDSVLSVARDVTDRWLAYEAEQRARRMADELREATLALTRGLDRETVLITLLDRLRRMVPFDRASVMLVEKASKVSVRAVFDGDRVIPMRPEARSEFDPTDHPVVRDILKTGAAVLIPDLRSHPGWSLPTDDSAEASWLGVPLFARGTVAGLFSLSKREAGYFNDEHLRLAEAMSSQASVAVENAVLFEQMQVAAARMHSLSRRLVDVQENERRHIARELHDEAGQALASLRYGLRLLEREVGTTATKRVAELMQTTDVVIDGLHRLAADLRPASLDHLGLEAALRQYTRAAGSKFGLEVRFKARGFTGEHLPIAVATALFRVVQEAMTNVVRHARASRVDVLAECRGDRVVVMVEDDGVGFDPEQVQRGEHVGLLGLRERAEALGGTLTVESAPGAGTTIVVEVSNVDPNPHR
jgi:PAS domain S-box-containing protein